MKILVDLPVFMDEFVRHLQKESRLLYPNPEEYIYAVDCLDAVHAASGLDKDTIGRELELAQERNP